MPVPRRPPGVPGQPQTSSPNPARAHRTNDSQHIQTTMQAPYHPGAQSSITTTPQQKIVQVLVNRLKNKLPCNSGVSLDRLEADTTIQQSIEALVELSNDSLDIIAWALTELLDRLVKQTDVSRPVSIEVLQSQLFVLKVLSMMVASRWSQASRSTSLSNVYPSSSDSSSFTRVNHHGSSDQSTLASSWQEPMPLNDNCARYVLSVMAVFLRPNPDYPLMLQSDFSDLSFRDFDSLSLSAVDAADNGALSSPPIPGSACTRPKDAALRSQSSSNSVKSSKASLHSTIQIPATRNAYEKTHSSLIRSSAPVNTLIAKYAGRIVFHLSASNWMVVNERLRAKIHSLTKEIPDNKDTGDLELMAHSALDRQRMVQLLIELSSLLVSMGREAQIAIAVPLRSAVWNWIMNFPAEFNEAIRFRGKTEGAPERVFDLLYSKSMASDERIFWPTLTILNCTTTDRLSSDFQLAYAGATKALRKEMRFGEDVLKHVGSGSKLSEVALVCLLDICRAATYVKPEGEVPLRMIALDVAHEIRAALLSCFSQKPFWESSEDIDIPIYAEALVAIYRFLPFEDTLPLFASCVEPERSEAVKISAVRACLTLIQEADRIKWQKPLDKLENLMSERFRSIFKATALRRPEIDQYGNMKRVASRPKGGKSLSRVQTLSSREILLLGILAVWRSNVQFQLKNLTQSNMEGYMTAASKVWEAPMDMSVKLARATGFYMLAESLYATMPHDPPDPESDIRLVFFKIMLPATLTSIATNLLHERTDTESQRLWVAIAHQLVELFVRKTDSKSLREIQLENSRVPAFAIAEIAFLVSLTSADSSVSNLAAKGLRLLSYAERQPDAPINPSVSDEDRSKRNPIYEQLGDPKIMIVGRIAQQKRIRKLVRLISYPSAVYVAVWQECYWRWRALSEIIFESMSDAADGTEAFRSPTWHQSQRFQWQNLTLFLAALGGACAQENQDLTSLTAAIPPSSLPDEMRVMQNPSQLVGTFITNLTDLLVVPDTQIRDTARDALGAELSPRLFSRLLKHLDETIKSIEEGAGSELTDAYLLFYDQFIAVIKLIVESAHVAPEDIMSIDISSTMLQLASFMVRFHGPATFRMKIKFCVMCESVSDRTHALTVRNESTARHSILDMVIAWIQPNVDQEAELATVQNELNMACLRTAVKLLDHLQLRPVESSNAGDDTVHVVSRLFNKYSSALLKCLEACHVDTPDSDTVSEAGSMHATKARLSKRDTELRDLVITGLSHLVSANTESGFKQCIQLAYDQDNRKRAIFAHVFARVLGKGTKFDPEDRSAALSRHQRLCELVKGSDMVLALTICDICPFTEVDMMISVLLNVFNTRTSLLSLMKAMIDKEVVTCVNEVNLFRSNSTCTRFLSAFAKIHGYQYLRTLIQPLIQTMADKPSGHGYDLDPNRVSTTEMEINKRNLEIIASSFLKIISSSVTVIPPMFREIGAHIANTVTDRYPNSKFSAMGAFIFLRFISPAIVSPETIDIELPKDSEVILRKGLMMITKIIQNLANNIYFGKEAHMTGLNAFLKENIKVVTRFLGDLAKNIPISAEEEIDPWAGTTSDETDIIVLHRFFDKHADKIGKELLSLTKPSMEGDASAINGKRAWDGLCALLVDLGAPLEVPRVSSLTSEKHQEYLDLLSRYVGRDTTPVEEIFVGVDNAMEDEAIFILRLAKINVEALDIELFMSHVFKTLNSSQYRERIFSIILDCTCFSSVSEVPLQWLKYCAELVPYDIRTRFSAAHILNPNVSTQKFLRRLYNLTGGVQFCSTVRAYSSVEELLEHIPEEALDHLLQAVTFEREASEVFGDTTMKSQQAPQTRPVKLRVGATHIRITSINMQYISPALSCRATEIVPLMDISDVYNVSMGVDAHEFIIRRNRHGATTYFASIHRDMIVKSIRFAKGRLKEAQMPLPLTERFSRFSNVPATLLHIGLLSVDLNDDELRTAAYDLLGAVCTYLKYDKSPIVTSQGFIPGDPSAFVIQLSERLAAFAPQLTLDFIPEVTAAMASMLKSSQRISCVHYMSPWVRNLTFFSNPAHPLFERSGARLRDCIRELSDMSANYPEIITTIQKCIWGEVNKLDPVIVDVILDELVHGASERGTGSYRSQAVIHAAASLASICVRGRVYSKLRRALSRVYSANLVSHDLTDHPHWNEIATLIRFALVVGPSSGQAGCDQLFVPELIHIVSLVAGFGSVLIRQSVHGIIVNLLQALYNSRTEESLGPELLCLITSCASSEKLRLFGLFRETPTSEYTIIDPPSATDALDNHERLTEFLLQIMKVASMSQGLLNVWHSRWMSLITSTAFQVSPTIQTRSFIALGALINLEVDDDYVYQILVALNTALSKHEDESKCPVVSIIRCLCKIVPALPKTSRYNYLLFWLAVTLLQASEYNVYTDATRLLCVTLENMEHRGMFRSGSVSSILLKCRSPLDEVTAELDKALQLSFESNFSFSLAAIIFKGIRYPALRGPAEAALRTLLCVTVRSHSTTKDISNGFRDIIAPDALGYFLALLPLSTTPEAYRRLLDDCNIDDAWLPDAGIEALGDDESAAPHISPTFLGVTDSNAALLVTSFVSTMLSTAQGDDTETEILFSLLSETANSFPQTVALASESLQDRVKDAFANSSNASIIRSVSNIFRVSLQENSRQDSHRGSASTIAVGSITSEENSALGPSPQHLKALNDIGMEGLAHSFQFLPRKHAMLMIHWIPKLVTHIIS